MKLDPDDPEAHRILGAVKLKFEVDIDKAIFHQKKLLKYAQVILSIWDEIQFCFRI